MKSAAIKLDFPEGRIEAQISLPRGRERLVALAFKMLGICDAVTDMGKGSASREGMRISCGPHCGACCRQLVPLSPPEAAMIFEFVKTMPADRKKETRRRFQEGLRRLEQCHFIGELERLYDLDTSEEQYEKITRDFFLLRIPCPFLRNESCSIYEVRPSMCREYLVTSPADHCNDPINKKIERLPLSIRLSEALARTWASLAEEPVRVIPLQLALKWTQENEASRWIGADATELLESVVGHLACIATEQEKKATTVLNRIGRDMQGGL